MAGDPLEKELNGFIAEALGVFCNAIKDIFKSLWFGIKKLRKRKALAGMAFCILCSVAAYRYRHLFSGLPMPDYVQGLLYRFCLILPMLYLIVLGKSVDKNQDRFRQVFQEIAFKARDGKYPYYCGKSKDGKKINYIFKANIPLEEWKHNKTRLETALNCNILCFSNGENKKIVKLTTVPNECRIPEMLYWSDEWLSAKSGSISVGQGALQEVCFNLNRTPHVLIAGETGSGKSVILRTCLYQMIHQGCRVFMIDFKGGVEFGKKYEQYGEVITERKRALEVLSMLTEENQQRLTLFRELEVKNLDEYNKKTGQKLCRIGVFSDEIAEMLDKKGIAKEDKLLFEQLEGKLATLARLSRATGINLFLGVQRPDANILPGQIKNNIPVRISGRFADKAASEIVLGNTDATELPDIKGRFLYKVGNETIEFQSYYFDDDTMLKAVTAEIGDMLLQTPEAAYNAPASPARPAAVRTPQSRKTGSAKFAFGKTEKQPECSYTEEEMGRMDQEILDWGDFDYDQ